MATLSSPGIGSGLDVNGIVTKLMAVESQPLTALDNKEASYQAKLSAFGSLSGALGSFQSALAGLTYPAKFQAVTATSADTTIITGSATSKAIAGTYNVNVTQLAQAQTIATAGQTTSATAIGDGMATTLTFQFGAISGGTLTNGVYSGAAFSQDANQARGSVVIDSSNNSLQGIRDAVNKAGIGVTATIVSDGSATPNHLVFTSTKTGASSSMKISVARNPLDPADPSLADVLAYDPAAAQQMTQSSAAQSTKLTVNGIDVTSSTSTVNEAIQGVTLSAAKIGSTTISVVQDSTAVKYSINSFVKTYNDLDSTIKGLTGYDPKTQKAGLLNGDSTVREIQTQIRNMLSSKLSDSGSGLATLSQIGLSFNKDGSMALDSTKLQTAITSNIGGIGSLFATVGTTSDSLVSFVSSTSATQPGSNAINISTLASQGTLTGSAAPANLTITAGSNDQLELVVDGVSTTIKLAPSTYTANGLVAALQSSINGATAFSSAGIAVSVSVDGSGNECHLESIWLCLQRGRDRQWLE
ncbi:flagellar filament capping protein FliD [Undibacterium arcticum]|uniref:flagellar filament capping protein FliD n=1 Tax=Undibacterium arcticum TaxID=1762892 RepID=UPI0036135A83